ncbi:hypothetical protein V8E54_007163 [Elaphomyces granulatus]|jgi:hypothetical protein
MPVSTGRTIFTSDSQIFDNIYYFGKPTVRPQLIALKTSDCPRFSEFILDVKRFVQYSRPAIEQPPLQVYPSAPVFAPVRSLVRNHFQDREL